MNREISDLLDQIDKNSDEVEPSATSADIQAVTDFLRTEFDLALPQVWADIWLRTDGVNWNGLFFYRAGPGRKTDGFIDSFIAVNQTYKDTTRGDYVFFGYGDDVVEFVYHVPSRTWQEVNPLGQDVFETYATPEELIIAVLKHYLEI